MFGLGGLKIDMIAEKIGMSAEKPPMCGLPY